MEKLKRLSRRSGQATFEFALMYGAVIVPLLFGIVFVSQICWIWHSMVEFTRDGARYAATHCYDANGVQQYMYAHVPPNIDSAQFQAGGSATINVSYFAYDPDIYQYSTFSGCTACVPDAVAVTVTNYQFQRYTTLLKSIALPPFTGSQAIGSSGLDETGTCTQ